MMPALRFSRVFLLFVSALSFNLLAQTPPKEGAATIAGVVTLNGEPMRNVVVTVQAINSYGSSQPVPPRAKTDANGRFRIAGIAAGQYTIGALASAFVTEGNQLNQSGFGIQGKTISVANGETIENLELTLKRGCVITGRVTGASGEPLIETTIQLSQINSAGQSTPWCPPMNTVSSSMMYRTDDRGVYRIYGLPPGKYKVSVGVPVRANAFTMRTSRTYIPETFHPDTNDEALAKVIELEEGQEASDVDIKAAEAVNAYEISGRVVDAETGQPVAGTSLAFGTFNQDGRMMGYTSGARTDAKGEFQILGARPGRHGIFIENREGKTDFYSEPAAVEIIDSDVAGVEVRARHGVSISGTVVIEGTNDPAVLARRSQISLEASFSSTAAFTGARTGKVGADGSFRVVGLPPGKVRLSGYSQLFKASLLRVERNGVPLKTREFEIRPGEQIKDIRIVYGYGEGIVRGQVKIIGAELPEGIRLSVNLRRTENHTFGLVPALLDERRHFIIKDLVPGQYEVRLQYGVSGKPTNEMVTKIFPRLAAVKQLVTVSDGIETQTTLTVDLSQED